MFLTYTFNKVPIGLFLLVFMSHGTQVTTMRNKHDQKMADCQKHDWFCYHSLPQHHRSQPSIEIIMRHLVESLGSATSLISQGDFIGDSGEYKQSSDFSLPVLISPQDCACHMSSVKLTDIIQTVLETSKCFLRSLSFIWCIALVNVWKLHISKKYFWISHAAFSAECCRGVPLGEPLAVRS